MKYYLGIDGGGTKTVAAVSDENGNILHKQTGKTINFYSVGMETARLNLLNLLTEIEQILSVESYESAFIGCSALDDEADAALVTKLCGGIVKAENIRMNSDLYIALEALADAKCPCVAVCGTGSMVVAKDTAGNIRTAGGWGHIIGDEGSAYAISVDAIRHCCNACDRGEVTPLLKSAERFFGVDNFRKAIDFIYSSDTTKDVLAGFSKSVYELAAHDDACSCAIIKKQAQLFAHTVLNVLSGCDVLGLYGGVFQHNRYFADIFSEKIKEQYPDIPVKLLDMPPEEGALMLARKM